MRRLVAWILILAARVGSVAAPVSVFQGQLFGVTATVHADSLFRAARLSLRGLGVYADGTATLDADGQHVFDDALACYLRRRGVSVEGVTPRADGSLEIPVRLPLLGRRVVRLERLGHAG